MQDKPTIAIIGGTGDLGSGLARLWAAAGYPIVIGSRSKQKAEAAARELGDTIRGEDNRAAAQAGDKGGDLPVPVRHPANQPPAARRAAAGPHHIGAGAGLVDEHQPRWIKRGLILSPALSCRGHVRPFLFAGVQNFF